MTNEETKALALELLNADSESKVIEILKRHSLWDNPDYWRLYGDKEGNWSQAGNQQSTPEASLVEKIVNSVDARLMRECKLRKINPEGPDAPKSIKDAIAFFYENRRALEDEAGAIIKWQQSKRAEESKKITIAATGARANQAKKMCLTIVDLGEGQSAKRLPNTILSLNAKNKQRIKFVQGKFNMGGSGALRFCGENGMQLVISRRDPKLEDDDDETASKWSVTVTRREQPTGEDGDPVHSEVTYLAPCGADTKPRKGEVLSFESEAMPLMPINNEAYAREITWGTAIKLFEFKTCVRQGHIIMKDGLLYALERLIPEIALPYRLHECREGFKGKKRGSFETTLSGLVVRLQEGKGGNLEEGFPLTAKVKVDGMEMRVKFYAFKEDKAGTYLKSEGIVFTINGQTQGNLSKAFFRRKSVGLSRLRDSLLVMVDCSELSTLHRENLFMNSRDRLIDLDTCGKVETELENLLKNCRALKELNQRRIEEDVESKLSDDKPLEEVIGKLLKSSPALNTVFLKGDRLSRPLRKSSGGNSGGGAGTRENSGDFKGIKHPSYFRFKKREYGKTLKRNCEIGRRVRIAFETDVENQYFDRAVDRGDFAVKPLDDTVVDFSASNIGLENGIGTWNFELPESVKPGSTFTLQTTVSDPTLLEPFINTVEIDVRPKRERNGGSRKNPKRKKGGAGNDEGGGGISLPKIVEVREGHTQWGKRNFNRKTACHVESDHVKTETQYTFYINLDNDFLQSEMKAAADNAKLLEAKFIYGNVLFGLALIRESEETKGETRPEDYFVEDEIRKVTKALAPVLIPLIDELSGLKREDFEGEDGLD